jgi:hypothetical protein
MQAQWVNAGIGPNTSGVLVKHPGEIWLRNTLDYREEPRRIVLAKNKKPATGGTTGAWTDLMRQEQFDRLHHRRFVRQDLSYEEAFKLLPAIKRVDLWKNCNDPHGTPPQHRDGGLEPNEWAGLYFQPSAQDRETAKEHSAIRAGDFG